jgi:hypothetical protein
MDGEQQATQQSPVQEKPQKTGGSKWWIWLLVVLGIIVIVGALGWMYIKGTPQYSLYKMAKAVEKKDYTTFSKYFNVDAVIDDLLDKAIVESQKTMESQLAASSAEEKKLAQQYFENLINQMRTQMKEKAKADIKKQVEGGNFYADYRGAIISVFLNTKVKISGNEADVTLINNKTKQTLPLKMRKKAGYWEIYKINASLEEIQKLIPTT